MPCQRKQAQARSAPVSHWSRLTPGGWGEHTQPRGKQTCWRPRQAASHAVMALAAINPFPPHYTLSKQFWDHLHLPTDELPHRVSQEFSCSSVTVPRLHAFLFLTLPLCLTSKQCTWENFYSQPINLATFPPTEQQSILFTCRGHL